MFQLLAYLGQSASPVQIGNEYSPEMNLGEPFFCVCMF